MGGLRIESQRAVIQIKSTRAKLNIQTGSRPHMQVTHSRAKMDLQRTMPTFKMNRDKINLDTEHLSISQFADKMNSDSTGAARMGISRVVDEGNTMGDLASGANAIPDIAVQRAKSAIPEINVRQDPPGLTELEWEPGGLEINWSPHDLQIEWDLAEGPVIEVEPHSVEISLSQYPVVRITWDPESVRSVVGNAMNLSV